MATSTFAVSQLRDETTYVDPSAATTRTVTLDKSAFDDTHTLVAMVWAATSTAITQPTGWTPAGVGGANGSNQLRIYTKRGDGVTKSITIDSASALVEVTLQVYAGYAGLTPILSGGANGTTGNNFPFSGISGSAGNGITILGIGLASAPSSWTAWSGSVNPVPDTPAATKKSWFAVEDYINGSSENTTVTWAGSRSQRYIVAVIPLVQVATTPKGGGSLNYTLGVSGSGSAPAVSTPKGSGSLNYTVGVAGSGSAPSVGSARGSGSLPYSLSSTGSGSSTRRGSGFLPYNLTSEGVGRKPAQAGDNTLPTQAQMPTNLLTDLYPAPTYEWSAGYGPMSSPYQWKNWDDAMIKLTDAASKGVIAGTDTGFVQPAALADISGAGTGTNTKVYPPYGIVLKTDSKNVYIRLRQRSYSGFSNVSARASSRLLVNNKLTSTNPVYLGSTIGFPANPENIVAGEYYVKITFPDAVMRTLEFTTHLEFGGLAIDAGATMVAPPETRHRIVVLDGSLSGSEKHQTGNFALTGGSAGTYTAISSMFQTAALALGFDDAVNLATGSSGYNINGDTVAFTVAAKLSELLSYAPTMVFLGSPNNDIAAGQSTSQLNTSTAAVLNYIRTNLPNVIIVMMGAFTPPVMGSQASAESTVAPFNAVMKANAQTYGAWFVNPTTGQTFDPSGTLRKTTSNWVYQNTSNIASDNQHPTQSGANTLGIMFADSIRMAFPEGSLPRGSGSSEYTLGTSGNGSAPAVSASRGSGSLNYTVGVSGSGSSPAVPTKRGSGSMSYAVSATGSGKSDRRGSGTLSYTETIQGTGKSSRRGSGSLNFTETTYGSGRVVRGGQGTLGFTEALSGSGSKPVKGGGESSFAVSLQGAGRAPVTIPATGGGSLTFKMGVSGSGKTNRRGSGSLAFGEAVFGSGTSPRKGSGSLGWNILLTGVGTIRKSGGGASGYTIGLTGSGRVPTVGMHRGSGSISYVESGFGSGHSDRRGGGVLTYKETLEGTGITRRSATGHLDYSLAARGSGIKQTKIFAYFGDRSISFAFGDTPVLLE